MNKTKAIEKWKRVPIKDIYLDLYDGPHATPKPSSEGPIFLGIKNITEDGKLDLSEIRHIAEEDFSNWTKRVIPRPDDIVFTYEATLNRYAIIPRNFRGCLGRRLALIRPNPAKINSRFLFYFFFSDDWRATISKNILSGSTVDRIPLISFPSFKISVPPLLTQHKIAAILSAYDDLIDNNTQRIAILEEMAQAIYQEWFVHFRYPGYKMNKMVESELGMTPENWSVLKVGNLVHRIPNGKKYDNKTVELFGAVPVLDQGKSGVIGYHSNEPDIQASRSKPVIVFANHTCYQRIIQFPFSTIQNVLPFLSNPECSRDIYWLHWATKDLVKFNDYKGHWPEFTSKKLLLPPATLCSDFGFKVKVLIEQVYVLETKNSHLHQMRNLLLPKLISGEIDVEALDIDIPNIIEPEERQEMHLMASPEPMDATQLALPLLQC